MKVFAGKLIESVERHAEEISREWCKAVRTNPRTPSYHSFAADDCFPHAMNFYRNLRRIYFSEKPYKEECEFLMNMLKKDTRMESLYMKLHTPSL
jgi:hypothetical protein